MLETCDPPGLNSSVKIGQRPVDPIDSFVGTTGTILNSLSSGCSSADNDRINIYIQNIPKQLRA